MVELLQNTCKALEEKNIEYMLSGSIAMSIYAVPRFTRDIDIVLNLKKEDADKFILIFSKGFHINKKTVMNEIARNGMFNVIDERTGYKIDFILKKESEFRNIEFERKQKRKVFDFLAFVVSIEDLILSKIIWIQILQSDTQITDIRALLNNSTVDKNYIRNWCEKLKLLTFNLI